MQHLYTLFIFFLQAAYRLAALFHPKAKAWVRGRRGWEDALFEDLYSWPEVRPRVWMHCASLGEFEQGRPVLEKIQQAFPEYLIVLTFFSPSGYELRKNYPGADYVCYLPIDMPTSARLFVDIVRPDLVIFVKYEFWFNTLQAVQRKGTPLVLISALFRPDQVFFQPWGKWFRRILAGFDLIFTQDEGSRALLRKYGIPATVTGDTRVDRVLRIVEEAERFPQIEHFCRQAPILVAGSTWPADEEIITRWWGTVGHREDWRLIIAPHDISEGHLQQIEKRFGKRHIIRYTHLDEWQEQRLLLIDNIGMLAALYRYARVAYIGGGFGAGIHNTLEPIAHGCPVLFGPRYEKFAEARTLVDTGGAFVIDQEATLRTTLQHLQATEHYALAAMAARDYVRNNQGATDRIVQKLFDERLLSGTSGPPL